LFSPFLSFPSFHPSFLHSIAKEDLFQAAGQSSDTTEKMVKLADAMKGHIKTLADVQNDEVNLSLDKIKSTMDACVVICRKLKKLIKTGKAITNANKPASKKAVQKKAAASDDSDSD
jgi:hypothetical protein